MTDSSLELIGRNQPTDSSESGMINKRKPQNETMKSKEEKS
jgi:hypothetical protein